MSHLRDEEPVGLSTSPRQHLPWSQNCSRHLRLYTRQVSSLHKSDSGVGRGVLCKLQSAIIQGLTTFSLSKYSFTSVSYISKFLRKIQLTEGFSDAKRKCHTPVTIQTNFCNERLLGHGWVIFY